MKKQLFIKMLLVALCLIGGSGFAWADVTPVSQDYSNGEADWTSGNTERYTVAVDGYLTVNPNGNGNNGTTITGTTVNGKVLQGSDFASSDDYTLIFDLQLTGGSGSNPQNSSFYIYDGANSSSSPILYLTTPYTATTKWKINGNNNQRVDLSKNTWYTFKLSKSGSYLYLTITPTEGGDPVFAQQTINVNSTKGGLGKMIFNTARYSSFMAIDNVELRSLESSDIPASAKTYSIKAKAGDTVLKTFVAEGAAAAGANVKLSSLNWAVQYNGHWYTINDENVATDFSRTFTKGSGDNEEMVVEYVLNESIAYFTEAEDLSGWFVQDQKTSYSSNGFSRFLAENKSTQTNFSVSAGKYDICASIFHRNGNGNVSTETIYEINGDAAPVEKGTIGGYGYETKATLMPLENIFLAEGSDIRISHGSGNSTACFDYIYLKKSAVTYTVKYMCGGTEIKATDASHTAPWGTYASLTDADKQDITYNGHLYRYESDNAASQQIVSGGTTVITATFRDLGEVATITYALNVGTSASTTIKSSATSTDATNITGVDIDQTKAAGDGAGATDRTTKLPIKTGANGETYDSPTNYVEFKYTVAAGKQFTLNYATIKVANVGGSSANNVKYKAELSDGTNTISNTYVVKTEDGTVETFYVTNDSEVALTGNVTLKLWAWTIAEKDAGGSAFRMGTPLEIIGTIDTSDEIKNAIADCKAYETSATFATEIDAEDFASTAEVYAFHSAWQIAQAQTNGSTDYSKAIMNRDFELGTLSGWTIYGDPANTSDEERNNGKIDATYAINGSYSYYTGDHGRNVSQNIATLPAGVYQLTAHVGSWSGGAPVRLFANGTLSAAENGDDHTPSLIFTVTGTEESIKIGIGGTGNNNDTDNTWGTWGYRVDNFTLTKIENVSKPISAAGWATYCSPYILDFTGDIDNLTDVYIVTGGSDGKLVTSSVKGKKVPANTGLLIEGTQGTVTIPVATTSDEISGNKLKGVTANTEIAANAGYVLMNGAKGVAFYKNTNAFTVGANTAYLPASFDATQSRAFFSFGDNATAVFDLNDKSEMINDNYYDLQGRRVSQPAKGLYIKDGKKVAIK